MNEPRLILASQSPRRRELLQLLGLPFEVTVADVAETPKEGETPIELVSRLSRAKAESAGAGLGGPDADRDALVMACDTIVALEEGHNEAQILGKPGGPKEAIAMLRLLRERCHTVYSAVTLLGPARGTATEVAQTQLTMRAYSESEIAAYVATGDPLDKAGAYAIQHEGFHPVREIQGCYASVMGLPLCHVTRCLGRWGLRPASDVPSACQAHTGHRCTVYGTILGP